MKTGFLSDHFTGIGMKVLTAVDANPKSSNQHEVTGSQALRSILGDEPRKQTVPTGRFPAIFIWLSGDQESIIDEGWCSWYDSRENVATRSPEWRLYYQTNAVTTEMSQGDVLFVALRPSGHLFFIVTPADSTACNQLRWMFGVEETPIEKFLTKSISDTDDHELGFAGTLILDELGIEPEETDVDHLDTLLEKFGSRFPSTIEFSLLARESLPEVSPLDDPDAALVAWMSQEEALFRRLERLIVADRLRKGFVADKNVDVDGFLSFSLSVQNRRKSRAGYALGNHIEEILRANGIRHKREATTEKKNGPDFLFPGQAEYHDENTNPAVLTMLAAKTSCKDRWRQVLAEANRIRKKHLLTLEPGISESQTDEMQRELLQLVVPSALHGSYKPTQQDWLMDMAEFLKLVKERQTS